MKIDIEHNTGDRFFYLTAGKIYPAIIVDIQVRDKINRFDKFLEGDMTQKTRITSYKFNYEKGRNMDGQILWSSSNTNKISVFHKTKSIAARALLKEAGFEPGLDGI